MRRHVQRGAGAPLGSMGGHLLDLAPAYYASGAAWLQQGGGYNDILDALEARTLRPGGCKASGAALWFSPTGQAFLLSWAGHPCANQVRRAG